VFLRSKVSNNRFFKLNSEFCKEVMKRKINVLGSFFIFVPLLQKKGIMK